VRVLVPYDAAFDQVDHILRDIHGMIRNPLQIAEGLASLFQSEKGKNDAAIAALVVGPGAARCDRRRTGSGAAS